MDENEDDDGGRRTSWNGWEGDRSASSRKTQVKRIKTVVSCCFVLVVGIKTVSLKRNGFTCLRFLGSSKRFVDLWFVVVTLPSAHEVEYSKSVY